MNIEEVNERGHFDQLVLRALDPIWEMYFQYRYQITHAKSILKKRTEADALELDDVDRVLSGEFHYFVSFTRYWDDHVHPQFDIDSNSVAAIQNASSLEEAKEVSKKVFGKSFRAPISESDWDFKKNNEPRATMPSARCAITWAGMHIHSTLGTKPTAPQSARSTCRAASGTCQSSYRWPRSSPISTSTAAPIIS